MAWILHIESYTFVDEHKKAQSEIRDLFKVTKFKKRAETQIKVL